MGRNDRILPLCDISTQELALTQDATLVRFVLIKVQTNG